MNFCLSPILISVVHPCNVLGEEMTGVLWLVVDRQAWLQSLCSGSILTATGWTRTAISASSLSSWRGNTVPCSSGHSQLLLCHHDEVLWCTVPVTILAEDDTHTLPPTQPQRNATNSFKPDLHTIHSSIPCKGSRTLHMAAQYFASWSKSHRQVTYRTTPSTCMQV